MFPIRSNGVKLALPTVGDGSTQIDPYYYANGTRVSGTANNPKYDDYLAIWDAYNGTGTGTGDYGLPGGWYHGPGYWSATPSVSGHVSGLLDGFVYNNYNAFSINYVAVEVW